MSKSSIVKIVKKVNPFVQIDKTCLEDKRLSWKAKGLHSYIMTLPSDWKLYLADLSQRSSDGLDSTRSAWNELKEHGYASSERVNGQEGYNEWNHTVYETPELSATYVTQSPDESNTGKSKIGLSNVGKPKTTNNTEDNNNTTTKKTFKLKARSGFSIKPFVAIARSHFNELPSEYVARWSRFLMAAWNAEGEQCIKGWEFFVKTFQSPAYLKPTEFVINLKSWIELGNTKEEPVVKPIVKYCD